MTDIVDLIVPLVSIKMSHFEGKKNDESLPYFYMANGNGVSDVL